jgi:hypothetical protein
VAEEPDLSGHQSDRIRITLKARPLRAGRESLRMFCMF